jgi:hypothetical protein
LGAITDGIKRPLLSRVMHDHHTRSKTAEGLDSTKCRALLP